MAAKIAVRERISRTRDLKRGAPDWWQWQWNFSLAGVKSERVRFNISIWSVHVFPNNSLLKRCVLPSTHCMLPSPFGPWNWVVRKSGKEIRYFIHPCYDDSIEEKWARLNLFGWLHLEKRNSQKRGYKRHSTDPMAAKFNYVKSNSIIEPHRLLFVIGSKKKKKRKRKKKTCAACNESTIQGGKFLTTLFSLSQSTGENQVEKGNKGQKSWG